jgi:hypothetical protein
MLPGTPLLYCGAGIHPSLYADKVALTGPVWQKVIIVRPDPIKSRHKNGTERHDIKKYNIYKRSVNARGRLFNPHFSIDKS